MKKIPLEDTLVGAYGFLFTNIVSIIGTLWLPFVVMVACIGGLIYAAVPHAWFMGQFPNFNSPKEMIAVLMPVLSVYPAVILLALVFGSMIMVGLMQLALGLKKGTTFVYFSLGGPVWRMLGALVLVYLIMLVLVAVLVGLGCLYGFVLMPMVPKPWGVVLAVVLGVIGFCIYIYTAFRLVFFVPAVVVAEGRLGIGRSWELGRGNFWRILVVLLLVVVPVGFVAGIAMHITVMSTITALILGHMHDHGPSNLGEIFRTFATVLPAFLVITLVERIAIMGLYTGAVGTAYNAVTGAAGESTKSE